MSWENLLMVDMNNKDEDQVCSLISVFVIRCLDSIIPEFEDSG